MKFVERLAALGFSTYADYLASPHWLAFREQYKSSGRPTCCAVCSTKPISLHHRSYARLGAERLDDVSPLCRLCHRLLHEMLAAAGRFVRDTDWAIGELRAQLQPNTPPSPKEEKPVPANGRRISWKDKHDRTIVNEFRRLRKLFPKRSKHWKKLLRRASVGALNAAIKTMQAWEAKHRSQAEMDAKRRSKLEAQHAAAKRAAAEQLASRSNEIKDDDFTRLVAGASSGMTWMCLQRSTPEGKAKLAEERAKKEQAQRDREQALAANRRLTKRKRHPKHQGKMKPYSPLFD